MNKITCKVFWVGQSKKGNDYIGVTFEEDGFISKSFVRVTAERAEKINVDDELLIPVNALQ